MSKQKPLSRRSFLACAVGTIAATGATALVAGCSPGPGSPGYTGYTDNDAGSNRDARGFGRGQNVYTGITDQDSGNIQDPAGYGRYRPTASRPSSGPTGLNDVDISDAPGNGRRGGGTGYKPSRCSDSDSRATTGRTDPQGHGTRCN